MIDPSSRADPGDEADGDEWDIKERIREVLALQVRRSPGHTRHSPAASRPARSRERPPRSTSASSGSRSGRTAQAWVSRRPEPPATRTSSPTTAALTHMDGLPYTINPRLRGSTRQAARIGHTSGDGRYVQTIVPIDRDGHDPPEDRRHDHERQHEERHRRRIQGVASLEDVRPGELPGIVERAAGQPVTGVAEVGLEVLPEMRRDVVAVPDEQGDAHAEDRRRMPVSTRRVRMLGGGRRGRVVTN